MLSFADYSARVERHIEKVYGVHVVTRDVPDPLTGDLDGAEIQIDYAVTAEQRLFLLLHLFGHTVQWNVSPGAFELGRPQVPPVSEDRIPALMNYEREAARYASGLLHEIGITDADQWLADYSACDAAYLRHYYVTAEKRDFLAFWREGTSRLPTQPVPPFTPMRRAFRSDGVVI
jgi:hypothetical protein